MKNYRVGFKKGGNVTDVSAGPWKKKQKPKPGPKPGTGLKDLEKLKKRKKLKRKKYDLKYSPGPGKGTLEKRFSREQGPGAPPIREQGPGAPPIPSPQDPKHFKEIPPRFAGGGKALRGLGRAFVKGGKV